MRLDIGDVFVLQMFLCLPQLHSGALTTPICKRAPMFAVRYTYAGFVVRARRPVPPSLDLARLPEGCTWIERGIGYSVIAEGPYDKLEELARRARQELAPRTEDPAWRQ